MIFDIFERNLGSPPYSRLDQDSPVEESCENGVIHYPSSSKRSRSFYSVLSAIFVTLAGVAGYLLGTLKSHGRCEVGRVAGTVAQGKASAQRTQIITYISEIVPIGTSRQMYNSSFAAPPPKAARSEPVWDSMIPSKSQILEILACNI